MLSVREKGGRPDSNRNHKDHDLGCCRYTTTTMSPLPLRRRRLITVGSTPKSNAGKSSLPASGPDFPAESGDDRTRTGACSPDKRVLSAAELRPQMK